MGVTSLIDLMSSPDAASARMADSRPAPGPLTFTSTERTPCSCANCAAFCAATCAANGVPLREPLNPILPALDQERVLPIGSEMATMVLLNVAEIDATPCGTFFFSFFFVPARRAPAFGARAVAILVLRWRLANYFLVAFFLPAMAPLRGPFRVRALVCVRWPRVGRPRRWRMPR